MIRQPGRSAASALLPAALTMRLFYGLAIDDTMTMNASWMCPLIGFILFLPAGLLINHFAKKSSRSPWENLSTSRWCRPFALLFAGLLLYDAASIMRLTASSSNIIALNDITVHLLVVPLGIASALIVCLGADAVGYSSRIWLFTLPVLMLAALIVQLKAYRLAWITPLFGAGFRSIILGAFYCAGCMMLLSTIWLIAAPDRNQRGILRYNALSAAAASTLLFALHISYPAMPDKLFTRAARIELVLSNGRMSLSPQFILNLLWFGGLFYLLAAEVCTASVYLRIFLPKLRKWILAAAISVGLSAIAIMNPGWLRACTHIVPWYFPGICIILLVMAAFARHSCKEASR